MMLVPLAFIFTSIALAQVTMPPDIATEPEKFASLLYDFFTNKNYLPLVAGILMLLVFLIRKAPLTKWIPWFGSKGGGWILNFSLALLGSGAVAVFTGNALGPAIFSGLTAAFAAAGIWEAIKDTTDATTSNPTKK